MKKIRIGNDIYFEWAIFDAEGNPYDMEGMESRIRIYACFQPTSVCHVCGEPDRCTRINSFTIEGGDNNVLHFTWAGTAQSVTGRYNLKLVIDEGTTGQVVFDEKEVFELVSHSWDEGGEDGDVAVTTIDLQSQLANELLTRIITLENSIDKEADVDPDFFSADDDRLWSEAATMKVIGFSTPLSVLISDVGDDYTANHTATEIVKHIIQYYQSVIAIYAGVAYNLAGYVWGDTESANRATFQALLPDGKTIRKFTIGGTNGTETVMSESPVIMQWLNE